MKAGRAALAGLLLGTANSLTNAFGAPFVPHALAPGEGIPWLRVLAALLGTMWAWAGLAFLLGLFASGWLRAMASGSGALLVATVAYYVSDDLLDVSDLYPSELVFWLGLSLVAGPVFGFLGYAARGRGRLNLLAWLPLIALMLLYVTALRESDDLGTIVAGLTLALAVGLGVVAFGRPWFRRAGGGPWVDQGST